MSKVYAAEHIILDKKEILHNGVCAIMLNDDKEGKTITNTVEELSRELDVTWLLYRDTFHQWGAWNKEIGFVILDYEGPSSNAFKKFERYLTTQGIKILEGN